MATNQDLVTIKFSDDQTSVVIVVDRDNLSSDFFQKILATPSNQYEISVLSAICAVNIIKKTPPRHTWHYILNYLSISKLFEFDVDLTLLYDLVIPIEGLDLYFDLIQQLFPNFESDSKNPLLIKCLETNFRCTTEPNILKSIFSKNKRLAIIKKTSKSIKAIDLLTNKNIGIGGNQLEFSKTGHLVYHFVNNSCVSVCGIRGNIESIIPEIMMDDDRFCSIISSLDYKYIIVKSFDRNSKKTCLGCYEFLDNKLLWKHEIQCIAGTLRFHPVKMAITNDKIIYYNELGAKSFIGIIDQKTGLLLKQINIFNSLHLDYSDYFVDQINISDDNTMVAFVRHNTPNNTCYIYNIETGQLVNKIQSSKYISFARFYGDHLLLVVSDSHITFRDIISGEIVYTISNAPNPIINISFFTNKTKHKILSIKTTSQVHIYDFEKEQFTNIFDSTNRSKITKFFDLWTKNLTNEIH